MTQTLAAVAHDAHGPFTFERLTLKDLLDHDVLVRVHSCGICHTDVLAKEGLLPFPLPAVLGHEGAGVVEAVGRSVTKVAPGDHVVMTIDYCGKCGPCQEGLPCYCVELLPRLFAGRRADGTAAFVEDGISGAFFAQSSFATHAVARENNVVPVARDVDLSVLGQLGCGIQTGAGAVLNRLKPEPGSDILVTGVGPVGMAAVMAAKVAGCGEIIAVDIRESRLEAAHELGATAILDGRDPDLATQVRSIAPSLRHAVDTTARQDIITSAFRALAPKGTLALVGAGAPAVSFSVQEFISGGRTVCGVSEGDCDPDEFIPRLVELYRAGRFPLDRLVTRFPFEKINEACAAGQDGSVIKAVLVMSQSL